MKRICALLLCLLLALIGSREEARTPSYTRYVYEKGGFGGEFTIDVKDDGTFLYYEGMLSSYIGTGDWRSEGDTLILTDELFTNRFTIGDDALIWRENGSDGFLYVRTEDGDLFRREAAGENAKTEDEDR